MPRANIPASAGFYPLNFAETDLEEGHVASGYATAIYPGDPVVRLADGSFTVVAAGTGAGITGVCVDIIGYRDAGLGIFRRNGAKLIPASTTYTADTDRSRFLFVAVDNRNRFVVKTNAAVASMAVARSAVGLNVDHAYSGADVGLGISGAAVDIAAAATTATLQWRIVGLNDAAVGGNDPTVTAFSVIVRANLFAGIGGLPAVLGV